MFAQKGTATLTANDEVFNRISSREPSLPPIKSQDDFSPTVSATCRAGIMTIKVETKVNFVGVVHARDYREPQCSGYGENTKITFLRINLLAEENGKGYCGVFYSQVRKLNFRVTMPYWILIKRFLIIICMLHSI